MFNCVKHAHVSTLAREHSSILRVPYPIREKKNVSECEAVRLYDETLKKIIIIHNSLVSRSLISALLDLRL